MLNFIIFFYNHTYTLIYIINDINYFHYIFNYFVKIFFNKIKNYDLL